MTLGGLHRAAHEKRPYRFASVGSSVPPNFHTRLDQKKIGRVNPRHNESGVLLSSATAGGVLRSVVLYVLRRKSRSGQP